MPVGMNEKNINEKKQKLCALKEKFTGGGGGGGQLKTEKKATPPKV
jgi:hypothetical protein